MKFYGLSLFFVLLILERSVFCSYHITLVFPPMNPNFGAYIPIGRHEQILFFGKIRPFVQNIQRTC